MDALDWKILAVLQENSRATMTDVANEVGLSLSACHRRFRELQDSNVIRGFSLDVDLNKLGFPFEAFVFVTIKEGDSSSIVRFERALEDIPFILKAHRLFGSPDFQLRVVARSQQHFQEIYDEQLTRLPGVQRLNSTLVMRTVVEHRIPLEPRRPKLER